MITGSRHDNDDKKPRTTDEIYMLNRAISARMDEVFTQKGVPVIPTIGAFCRSAIPVLMKCMLTSFMCFVFV